MAKNGVNIHKFVQHFKGNFKGQHFDTDIPPKEYYQIANSCKQY